ncbi:hypothetical protein WDU94_008079 [Cyamophila willieti]
MIPVNIIHICSAGNYVLIRNNHESEDVKNQLNNCQFHDEDQFVPEVHQTVAVYSASDKQWYRAVVLNVDLTQRVCLIRYTEFGCTDTVTLLAVHPIPLELDVTSIPAQTLDVTLCDVFPVEKSFSGHYMQLLQWPNEPMSYIRDKYLQNGTANVMYEHKAIIRGQNFGKLWLVKSNGKRFSLGDRLVTLGRAMASNQWQQQVEKMSEEAFVGLTRGNGMFPRRIILETYRRRQQRLGRSRSRHGRSCSEQRGSGESRDHFQINSNEASDKGGTPRRSKSLTRPSVNIERGRERGVGCKSSGVDSSCSISEDSEVDSSVRREMKTLGRRMERESRRENQRVLRGNEEFRMGLENEGESRGRQLEVRTGHRNQLGFQGNKLALHQMGRENQIEKNGTGFHTLLNEAQIKRGNQCQSGKSGHGNVQRAQDSRDAVFEHEFEALIRRENELEVRVESSYGREESESPSNFDYFGDNGKVRPTTGKREIEDKPKPTERDEGCFENEQSRPMEMHDSHGSSDNYQPAARKRNSLLSSLLEGKKPPWANTHRAGQKVNEGNSSETNTLLENRHTPTDIRPSSSSLLQKILSQHPPSRRPIVKDPSFSKMAATVLEKSVNEPSSSLFGDVNSCSTSTPATSPAVISRREVYKKIIREKRLQSQPLLSDALQDTTVNGATCEMSSNTLSCAISPSSAMSSHVTSGIVQLSRNPISSTASNMTLTTRTELPHSVDTSMSSEESFTDCRSPPPLSLKSCLTVEHGRSSMKRNSSETKDTSMYAAFMKSGSGTNALNFPSSSHPKPHVSPSNSLPPPRESSVLNVCTPVVHSKLALKIGGDISVGSMENRLHYSIGENKQFPPVSLAQVASVPAILDHRNVAIIHTLKSQYNSAYLGSLISTLIEHKARYCNKKSFEVEPFVLILAPNSKVCDELYKTTTCFVDKFYDVTVKTIYGSSPENESKALLRAVNGCDILITTPRCLDRLKESHLVGLSWVFHYVLERADILFEKFSKEVLDFLGYLQVISKARLDKYSHLSHVSCPELQIILSAELYNRKLETFVLNKMSKPVLVFSNFLEAAIYGRVKFSLSIISNVEKKKEHLLEILRSCSSGPRGECGEKVAIVCSDACEVLSLDSYLSTFYSHTLPIHSGLNINQLTNMVMKWRTLGPNRKMKCGAMDGGTNETPILICDDEALGQLYYVHDATVLIHFSLPSNKKTMSDRFQLVKDSLVNLLDDQDGGEVQCARCHLLLDESNDLQFHDIVSLCKRINLDIPDRIVEVAQQVKYKREADKRTVPLCIQLLQFGQCYISRCKYRHAIVSDIDAPVAHLPKDGMIKFNVLSVLDGSCFSIRLLEKLPHGSSTWVPHRDKLSLLNLALRQHFADKSNRVTHYSPYLGDLVAVERDEGGSAMVRARVIEIVSVDETGAPSQVKLRLCDAAGKPAVYPVSKLYTLPQDLKLYPDQVLLVFTTRVLPMDEDIQWNGEIVSYMESMIQDLMKGEHDKYFVGKIVLALNNIYLLDPFQCSEYLPSSKVEISHLRMRHSLLSTQRAIANPAHLDLLYAQCVGVEGAVPEYMRDVAPQILPLSPLVELPSPKWAHLVQDEINHCTLVGIVDPSLFFLRLTNFESILTKLNKEIQTDVNRTSTRYCRDQCSPGLLCLARPDDKSGYNRVQITNTEDPNVAMVLFVDYSDKQDIPYDQLVPIYRPQLISNLPFQAIECCLAGVEPLVNNQWTKEAYDLLDDFNHLFVRVVSLNLQGIETKGRRYSVELFDLDDRINVNKHLVEQNHAKYTEDAVVCLSQDDESVFLEIEELIQPQSSNDDGDDEEEKDDVWQDLPEKQKMLTDEPKMPNEKSSQDDELYEINEEAITKDEAEEFVRNFNEIYPGFFPELKPKSTKPTGNQLEAPPSTSSTPHEVNNSSSVSSNSKRVSNPHPPDCEDYSEPKLTLLPSDVYPNMPSLTVGSYAAKTQWYQTEGHVFVQFDLPGLHEKFTLTVESNFVHFYVDIEDRSYSNQLPLLCHIVPDLSEVVWNGFELRLKLVKQHPSLEWVTLLQDGLDREMRWLAYDVDHLYDQESVDEQSGSDEEEPGPPAFRMQGLKHNRHREDDSVLRLSSEGEDNAVSVIPEDM